MVIKNRKILTGVIIALIVTAILANLFFRFIPRSEIYSRALCLERKFSDKALTSFEGIADVFVAECDPDTFADRIKNIFGGVVEIKGSSGDSAYGSLCFASDPKDNFPIYTLKAEFADDQLVSTTYICNFHHSEKNNGMYALKRQYSLTDIFRKKMQVLGYEEVEFFGYEAVSVIDGKDIAYRNVGDNFEYRYSYRDVQFTKDIEEWNERFVRSENPVRYYAKDDTPVTFAVIQTDLCGDAGYVNAKGEEPDESDRYAILYVIAYNRDYLINEWDNLNFHDGVMYEAYTVENLKIIGEVGLEEFCGTYEY